MTDKFPTLFFEERRHLAQIHWSFIRESLSTITNSRAISECLRRDSRHRRVQCTWPYTGITMLIILSDSKSFDSVKSLTNHRFMIARNRLDEHMHRIWKCVAKRRQIGRFVFKRSDQRSVIANIVSGLELVLKIRKARVFLHEKSRARKIPRKLIGQSICTSAIPHPRLITSGEINEVSAEIIEALSKCRGSRIGLVVAQVFMREKARVPKLFSRLPRRMNF